LFPHIGVPELIIILVVALVIFGPKRLPEVGRSLGKTINEFRRSSREMVGDVTSSVQDVKREIESVKESVSVTNKEAAPVAKEKENEAIRQG